MQLMDTVTEFDSRISPTFEALSIKVISYSTADGPHKKDYPIEFEILTRTKIDLYTQEAITHIISIQGYIPGSISIGHQHESLFIIPQSVHIECNYKLLSIDKKDMQRILQHAQPNLYYSEWLIDAIKNANILVELKTNQDTFTEWPFGIKSAVIL
ncbi:hypothetical protein FJQ98_20790 [Lysinibacillus agricola]|uniref:Uncharacterized protein n=1 Tax=Lysinibacillus agricola TaxID=2590012 RepID=A0ABX7ANU5_9BACI|nr:MULTISPECIES: hypothetical protein [Lysinibacillus]KOS60430.1 hypothetical protein AN161_23465 [Lysinibacillus sp. FJAT-14222]QQP11603.1 hypothetical protein FJQ98_20790 [Lysinibacillus agricola]